MAGRPPVPSRASVDSTNDPDNNDREERASPLWSDKAEIYSLRSPSQYLISGRHLEHFVKYLRRPYQKSRRPRAEEYAASRPRDKDHAFAILYDFQSAHRRTDLWQPSGVDVVIDRNSTSPAQSQILFMRGSESPEWLNAIGTAFDVEPEFFYHHTRLFSKRHSDGQWSWPPLASDRATTFRLSLTTMARLSRPGTLARDENHLRKLRDDSEEAFVNYLEKVRKEESLAIGDSYLRKVSVHDGSHLSIEQQVSIHVKHSSRGWFALVWLDVGTGFADAPGGEFFLDALGPHREGLVVEPTVFGGASTSGLDETPPANSSDRVQQNAKHLCHEYDGDLEPMSARTDPLYALNKLLRFAAVSESCFLNMMKDVARRDAYHGILKRRTDASLSNLQYNAQILKEHVLRLRSNVQTLEQSVTRPKQLSLDQKHAEGINIQNQRLLDDFRDLLRTAEECQKECEGCARSVMDLASHAESRKAIKQAQGVEQLTRLGTIFLPLSLITSFFGMNSASFGQGSVPLWAFFAVAGPTLFLSLVFLFPRFSNLFKRRLRKSETSIEMDDWDASMA